MRMFYQVLGLKLKMKIIAIKGGLGNQMFQYAYGRNLELSKKNVLFDVSFYYGNKSKIDTARDFKLDNFNIKTSADFSKKKRPLLNLIKKIQYHLNLADNGFWNSEKYFSDNASAIREEFTLKPPLSKKAEEILSLIKNTKNSISLHIRRGDYVNDKKTNQYHGTCDSEYYSKALEYITSKVGNDINLFIFSDDIKWVKENMFFGQQSLYPTTYVSSPEIPDYEELILMSKCQHNIIANSSFSWWGAWLNENRDKIVIAPKRWALRGENNFKDIVPQGWYRI